MSQVYSTEPQTTGRIILNTTHGPIDIKLWCKECPTTTRTFLQLCLDGYYNGMIFHRIINNFLIQTGESCKDEKRNSSTIQEDNYQTYMSNFALGKGQGGRGEMGVGGDKIPGSDDFMSRKRLELSPRIRFNHRGQVAMALPLDEDDNISEDHTSSSLARQFFITMDEAPFLQSKYVIFGTVHGDTIFNAMRIGRTETIDEESGQLADVENAPMIKDVRIESHLFDDLVMTNDDNVPWKVVLKKGSDDANADGGISEVKKRRKKRKGKKDLNVLSFGAEMEEGDLDEGTGGAGMLSTYDVLNKGSHASNNNDHDAKTKNKNKNKKELLPSTKKRRKNDMQKEEDTKPSYQIEKQHNQQEHQSERTKIKEKDDHNTVLEQPSTISSSQRAMEKISFNNKSTSDNEVKRTKIQKISAVEARRLKYLKSKIATSNQSRKGSKLRDDNTMLKLSAFKSKMLEVKGTKKKNKHSDVTRYGEDDSLAAKMIKEEETNKKLESFSSIMMKNNSSAPVYSGQILEEKELNEKDSSWMKNQFKCKRHIDHDSKDSAIGGDGRNMEDYEVIDEKRRGNFNSKGYQKSKFRENNNHRRENKFNGD